MQSATHSGFEFRPAGADELASFRELGGYVFAEPSDETQPEFMQPEWTHCAFDGARLVASSAGFPFKMRMNGRPIAADGVTAVGTDPGYRRRGLVRRMIGDLLRRAHDNEVPVSILWASMAGIYQRFGYGLATAHVSYSFDPALAGFEFGEPSAGCTRRLPREQAVPIAANLYREFIEPRNLLLHRAPVMWELPFRDKDRRPYCAVHYDADDRPDGYLFYTTKARKERDGDDPLRDQDMELTDLVWRDMNAYRGLWEYLRSHDLVASVSTYFVAEDDPAPGLLLEPRVLNRKTGDGIWLRVVDAAKTLGSRGYETPGEATIEIAEDVECPWNVGSYRLQTDGTQAEARRISGEGEVRIGMHGLASLLAGYTRLSQLVRIGRAEVVDERRLPALDALFATRYAPHCMNGF